MTQLVLVGHGFVHPASLPCLNQGRIFANVAEAFVVGWWFEEVEGWKISQALPLLSIFYLLDKLSLPGCQSGSVKSTEKIKVYRKNPISL